MKKFPSSQGGPVKVITTPKPTRPKDGVVTNPATGKPTYD